MELLARLKSRSSLVDQECSDAAVIAFFGIRDCKNNYNVGDRTVGNENLGAIDDESAIANLGLSRHRKGVGSSTGFGHCMHANNRAVAQTRQIASLLFLV